MDESGLCSKALPDTGLAKKPKKCEGGKKSKERLTVAIFVSSSEFNLVIGKRKVLRCFRKLPNPAKPYGMQYFHSKKA